MGYARAGIAVFPLQRREKKPLGRTTGLHAATRDPETVAAWWSGRRALPLKPDQDDGRPAHAGPECNIGIATGALAGFWVLDLDGVEAEAGLTALEAVHGALPPTVEQRTGQGRHLCFAWDGPSSAIRNSAGKIGPKIDVRGEGGYIVAPPSVHPSGRVYAWTPGRAPGELPFAAAPAWLIKTALPSEAPTPIPRAPRVALEGRASRYGEACLSTACREIASAPAGRQQSAVWGYACFVGGLVGGREIESAYARDALIDAALRMTPAGKPWARKEIESHVERGLAKGELHPRTAPEQRGFAPAAAPRSGGSATPAQAATQARDAAGLWASARPADCGAFRTWLRCRGLDVTGLPDAAERLRAHPAAPVGGGRTGPALLLPLIHHEAEAVPAIAILPLIDPAAPDAAERPTVVLGEADGRVCLLTAWPESRDLLVAIDLQDAWALGANAAENGHALGVVLAPTRRAFAGGALGDRFGRIDPRAPYADPGAPPWLTPGAGEVWLAVRGDLRTPELRTRRTWGGTDRVQLQGDDAARFYGGLAEQAWLRGPADGAGANAVRVLRPGGGMHGFNGGRRGVGR